MTSFYIHICSNDSEFFFFLKNHLCALNVHRWLPIFNSSIPLFFQLRQKIVEAHANVKDLNLLEAKVNFIKAWQSLPDYGVSLFVVRFHGEKKDELLGVASNKIMRMSLNNGDHLKTWRFSTMKVNSSKVLIEIWHIFIALTFEFGISLKTVAGVSQKSPDFIGIF